MRMRAGRIGEAKVECWVGEAGEGYSFESELSATFVRTGSVFHHTGNKTRKGSKCLVFGVFCGCNSGISGG